MENSSKFKINIKDEIFKDVVVANSIGLEGYLDAHTAPDLEMAIRESISSGTNNILIDFEKLDYISSAGFGVFMEFIEEVRNSGGDIKMTGMSPKIHNLFELLGFNVLFEINNNKIELLNNFITQ
jgi:anti-sigma B factor antagonist